MEPPSGRCEICGQPFAAEPVFCLRCEAPHHQDCFHYLGRCAMYGCGDTRYVYRDRTGQARVFDSIGPDSRDPPRHYPGDLSGVSPTPAALRAARGPGALRNLVRSGVRALKILAWTSIAILLMSLDAIVDSLSWPTMGIILAICTVVPAVIQRSGRSPDRPQLEEEPEEERPQPPVPGPDPGSRGDAQS